jgi:hypothetical protein
MVAFGPDGPAQPLAPVVSPAYGGGDVTFAGPENASGAILSKLILGQSARLVRLVPTEPCLTNCTRVATLQVRATGPGFCNQGEARAKASLVLQSETGAVLPGVRVTGHFLDDYWLDQVVVGETNAQGQVQFTHRGPPCVGAFAFLVTNAETRDGRTFDRTAGVLADFAVPQG